MVGLCPAWGMVGGEKDQEKGQTAWADVFFEGSSVCVTMSSMLTRGLIFFLCLTSLLSGCLDLSRPDLKVYEAYARPIPGADAPASVPGLRVTHFGTTTLLFDDGQTQLMIDGFFTRPSDWGQLFFGKISSDRELIHQRLDTAGVQKLAALMVFHSHYDHAMDIGPVATYTGADVLGSASTANIASGEGIDERRIITVKPGKAYTYGAFTVTFLVSQHTPLPFWLLPTGLMGDIDKPLHQPVSLYEYREGETYAIHIAHPWGTSLLKGGALRPGELTGYQADTVFMCTPGLDKMTPEEQSRYFREVVLETGVSRIVPVHWDDFATPLAPELTPMPRSAENLDASMAFLLGQLATQPEIELRFLPAMVPQLLFQANKQP